MSYTQLTPPTMRTLACLTILGTALPGANGRLQLYSLDFPDGRGVIALDSLCPMATVSPRVQ